MTQLAQSTLFDDGRPPVELHRGMFADFDHRALLDEINPQQYWYNMYGETGPVPRKERWQHQDPTRNYRFGGRNVTPTPFGTLLTSVIERVESDSGERFDSSFANYYIDGYCHIPWHADDKDWIVDWIASVSFGGSRTFRMRSKSDHSQVWEMELGHGDVLYMLPGTQERYEHCVPLEPARRRPRLNLTLRQTKHGR